MRKRQQERAKKRLIIASVLIVAVIALVVTLLVVNGNRSAQRQAAQETTKSETEKKESSENTSSPLESETPKEDEDLSAIDPATIGTVDITPASLTVSYIKGVGGFAYEVLRSADGRKYIELKNSELAGTKCSDDTGVFVSILEAPNESEKATISKTMALDGVQYGLSVASPTCTSEPELLKQYQDAFSKPFGLLKKL